MLNTGRTNWKLAALLVCLSILLASCGKKGWPHAQNKEDVFTLQDATVQLENNCALVSVRIDGAAQRLDSLVLEIEDLSMACETCPFSPQTVEEISLDDKRVSIVGNHLSISYCGLFGKAGYRFRLIGNNQFSTLAPASTPVIP